MQIKSFNTTMGKQGAELPVVEQDSGYHSEKSDTPGSSFKCGISHRSSSWYKNRLASTPCKGGEHIQPCLIDPIDCFALSMEAKTPTKAHEQNLQDTKPNDLSPQWMRSCISGRIIKRPGILTRSPKRISESSVSNDEMQVKASVRKSLVNTKATLLQRLLDGPSLILQLVLSFLPSEDLKRVSQVNRALRMFIHKDAILMKKKQYLLDMTLKHVVQIGKENVRTKKSVPEVVSYPVLSPRKCFGQIENLHNTPSKGKGLHKVHLSLSDRFIKEGQKLGKDDQLQKCVKCKHPARFYKAKSQAICTRTNCGFNYCTNCFLKYHEKASDCIMNKPRPKTVSGRGICPAKCRRNLRRL